jgi:hypothetical protein
MLENTLWYAVALILVIALVSFVLGRQKAPEA